MYAPGGPLIPTSYGNVPRIMGEIYPYAQQMPNNVYGNVPGLVGVYNQPDRTTTGTPRVIPTSGNGYLQPIGQGAAGIQIPTAGSTPGAQILGQELFPRTTGRGI